MSVSASQPQAWRVSALLLGVLLLLMGLHLEQTSRTSFVDSGDQLLLAGGAALILIAATAFLLRRRLDPLLQVTEHAPRDESTGGQPYATLFLASFVALFVEVLLIRYSTSQIRIFSFYKNVPLVASYLGLGLGCWLGCGRAVHALSFLLWTLLVTVFLSLGSLGISDYLGKWAATGSSEHILGDVVAETPSAAEALKGQLFMGLFCVGTLVVITLLFTLLGRLLGEAFEGVPRLPGYTTNIVGSLTGILLFLLLSYLETPPWVWLVVGLTPLLWWLHGAGRRLGVVLIILTALSAAPYVGDTVWSRYQKLVGQTIPPGPGGTGSSSHGYLVEISDVFYQVALDLRPDAVAEMGQGIPHYDGAFAQVPPDSRVLIVGAGTGNDVAAALRAQAAHVDAVDIDPAIVEMGREHHPEQPYADPRVHVTVDDARAAFRYLPHGQYDAVVFGLLDSHTQLGLSSVRLDNYVFTQESLASVRPLLKPGGRIILTAATYRPWFRDRFQQMLAGACETPVEIVQYEFSTSYGCQVLNPKAPGPGATPEDSLDLPSDDWPFLYLPARGIPRAYLVVVVLLAAASVTVLRSQGLRFGSWAPFHGHLFFLGAAFLLMEVYAVNRLALLFGTTWLVSAVTIALVLSLIVAANFTVALLPGRHYALPYLGLVASLLLSYFVEPSVVVGRGLGSSLLYGVVLLLPVYFAGIVFARSFRTARLAGPAIGANMLGSVLGGWVEYVSMATGIRALAILALVFYLASLLMLLRHRRHSTAA